MSAVTATVGRTGSETDNMVSMLIRKSLIVSVMAALLVSTSCTFHQPSELQPASIHSLKEGDYVRFTTRDGKKISFEIVDITFNAIVGERERVDIDEVVAFERMQEVRGLKKVYLVIVLTPIVALSALYYLGGGR